MWIYTWLKRGASGYWLAPSIFLFHTHTHTHTHTLETASSVGMPPILSPARHTAHDRRPPAPPERRHCARSLSRWSQFSACGQSHIAHIVAAPSPSWRGGGVCSLQTVGSGGGTTCGALIAPTGNRHLTFWFLRETEHLCFPPPTSTAFSSHEFPNKVVQNRLYPRVLSFEGSLGAPFPNNRAITSCNLHVSWTQWKTGSTGITQRYEALNPKQNTYSQFKYKKFF